MVYLLEAIYITPGQEAVGRVRASLDGARARANTRTRARGCRCRRWESESGAARRSGETRSKGESGAGATAQEEPEGGEACKAANIAAYDMATACSSNSQNGRSQLHVTVASAKLKRRKNWFGTAIYVELSADGELKKSAKSHSSSNPKWDEHLIMNVTPHTKLEFKIWSHHTLKSDALLGKATLDICQALELHNRKLENIKEVLKLTLENKNGVVQTGDLTVFLDGMTVDQESVPNGTAPATKVQQNGDAIHVNGGESSTRARTRSNTETSNCADSPSTSSSRQSAASSPVVNGESNHSPCHLAARPKSTTAPKSSTTQGADSTVNGEIAPPPPAAAPPTPPSISSTSSPKITVTMTSKQLQQLQAIAQLQQQAHLVVQQLILLQKPQLWTPLPEAIQSQTVENLDIQLQIHLLGLLDSSQTALAQNHCQLGKYMNTD
ncbi:hypothetical protein scyTo_0012017 [Scyliorhinus torazame]|uniref:C2 domain-containing protein n=1 Tax=Scyliorhinus torazame TaxID=75743 RepID=A0A401P064_SCYTO|nr:hypothetical protein [Scyliorhinus torazame]